jgi:hypothetical protein
MTNSRLYLGTSEFKKKTNPSNIAFEGAESYFLNCSSISYFLSS